jgi:hypothetical protein
MHADVVMADTKKYNILPTVIGRMLAELNRADLDLEWSVIEARGNFHEVVTFHSRLQLMLREQRDKSRQ